MSNQIFFPENFDKEEALSKLEAMTQNPQEITPKQSESPPLSSELVMDVDDDLIIDMPSPNDPNDPFPEVFGDEPSDDDLPTEADFQPGYTPEPEQKPNQVECEVKTEIKQEVKREPFPDMDMIDLSKICCNCESGHKRPNRRNRKRNHQRQAINNIESGGHSAGRPSVNAGFNEKRNIWNRQEKLPAHKRLPRYNNPLAIRDKFGPISHQSKRDLEAAIKKSDLQLIRTILRVMHQRKQQLTGKLVKKLSLTVLHASYKGKLPLRITNPLSLEIFPRYCRLSVAAISLCDPVRLLEYLNYPSFGYKINRELSGETLWRRVAPSMRVKCYRKAFESGAALVKRM